LDSTEDVSKRLREQAAALGVEPSRIVFAAKLRNPDHLARYPLADLFLDTTPYGAHTTCSDALWMGVPIITHAGRGFASRVCGSLVRSAGMPEMIAATVEDYVAQAVDFGLHRDKLTAIRQRLAANRDSCVLFNTPLLVSKLEELYAEMMDEFVAGRLPRPDLSNLEVYNDIGIELDQNDVELLTVPEYEKQYLDRLAAHDRYAMLRPDQRLWTAAAAKKSRAAWDAAA
ncbi:MAG: hypothetical protein FJX59_15095, partial [Alphaproteobacteria bacterium]|nr:hypothetical protein [Alphaproteobacteria bacterium]